MTVSLPFDTTWKLSKHRVRDQIKADFNYRCAFCGRYSNKLTLDHLKPKCRGGLDHKRNLVPACSRCNQAKGSQPWLDWYTPELPYYSETQMQILKQWSGLVSPLI